MGLALLAGLMGSVACGQTKWVKPHINKNGTYVKGYFRTQKPKIRKIRPIKSPKAPAIPKARKPKANPAAKPAKPAKPIAPSKPSKPAKAAKSVPTKPRAESGFAIKFPPDNRFNVGDRLVSIKDASGKTHSVSTERKLQDFLRTHAGSEDVTVRIRRDGKYLTRKVKQFGNTFLF